MLDCKCRGQALKSLTRILNFAKKNNEHVNPNLGGKYHFRNKIRYLGGDQTPKAIVEPCLII